MSSPFERFAGTRILVTGASGFIGSHLCRPLTAAGAEVHAVSRRGEPAEVAVADQAVRWWRADLADPEAAAEVAGDVAPDYVFHLASHVYGSRDLSMVLPTFRDNLATTVNLLTALSGGACRRIVLAGSLEEPDATESAAVPSSPYAASKFAAGAYARLFHALYGTPVTTARIFMVYGPGQRDLKKLVPYVALSLLRGESPKLAGGTREVDWIYVEDLSEGLAALASADDVEGQSVDLGSGELVSVRAVAETLHEIVGGPGEPLFGAVADRAMEQVRVASAEATYSRIGWRPRIGLRQGLGRTVDWCRELIAAGRDG